MLWKLIKLEVKKTKWRGMLLSALLTTVLLVLWVVGSDVPNNEVHTYDRAFVSIMNYVGITFIVFASVLMSRMVIDEYRNKTITLLFAYPVPRHLIFVAKLLIIAVWTFATVLLSNIVVVAMLLLANTKCHYITEALTRNRLLEEALRMVIFALSTVGAALVPMFFGMLRKTMPALIVSSFVISNAGMIIVNSEEINRSFSNFTMVAMLSLVIGSGIAYAGVRRSSL
ncbi:ABC transporter permease [Paenibacillus roseipurpureus]|uniref:ABC transporter permease n=1 Tax=Paenibacillus roseopurpureus TaxID=2918901 RepID=A0AA96RMP9_9BACL|nr:ABC transporter permease [Paenibacillus sp. MBLB1832]WNR44527.1 ABC transporter permease [Paenibacillus sp. MBLB1832]